MVTIRGGGELLLVTGKTMSPYPAELKPSLCRLTPGSHCKRNVRIFWNAYRPARRLAQTGVKDCAS